MELTIHHQKSGQSERLYHSFNRLLKTPGLKAVRFSVAYARWDGIGLISQALEGFLKAGGKFQAIYGAGNGVTTPDALQYGLFLNTQFPGQTYAGFIEDEYANAIYHPKFYQFLYSNYSIALIGSANLTGGGLVRNGELTAELSFKQGGAVGKQLSSFWKTAKDASKKVTVTEIRRIAKAPGAGSERRDEVGGAKSGKPILKVDAKLAPKPLFEKILGLPAKKAAQKSDILAGMDTLTDRPKHLYLQIFERETGGHKGEPGAMVQLPVATLGAYFGMTGAEGRELTFEFPKEKVRSNVIHNSNHTHQVRLSPIFSVKRPAIIHFERIGEDRYGARFVPASSYTATLKTKCPEQRRAKSRRWGIFA
jgi:HKD family nuclease